MQALLIRHLQRHDAGRQCTGNRVPSTVRSEQGTMAMTHMASALMRSAVVKK